MAFNSAFKGLNVQPFQTGVYFIFKRRALRGLVCLFVCLFLPSVNMAALWGVRPHIYSWVPTFRNNGSEREAGHYRHHREEKAPVVWPR